jgi:hypothetical protein
MPENDLTTKKGRKNQKDNMNQIQKGLRLYVALWETTKLTPKFISISICRMTMHRWEVESDHKYLLMRSIKSSEHIPVATYSGAAYP